MKQIIYLFAAVSFFSSCGEKKEDTAVEPTPTEKVKPEYLNSVRYSDWEIGKPENIKTVLDLYKAWDKKDMAIHKPILVWIDGSTN